MRLAGVFALALLASCVPVGFNDSRVTVGPALDANGQPIAGALRVERLEVNGWATRINSSQAITDWAPKEGCVRVTTVIGGPDKALRCAANPVVVFTLGQLDVGLVPAR